MKWRRYWLESLIALVAITVEGYSWTRSQPTVPPLVNTSAWTAEKKFNTRERVKELWYHGYDNYMKYAFPLDELAPLSCSGRGPDWENPHNIAANDVAGNFSLTLIDVLDTLVVLNDTAGFDTAVRNVIDWVSFDVNTRPQVFETTIRVLGGLLSGHIFATKPGPFFLPWYKGELLDLSLDLGNRLLPAFDTVTGIPYARSLLFSHLHAPIHLRHGILKGETVETCTAGAGSLILEFATLSRLTGDDRFEKAASKAFFALWNRRSSIGLVGNTINTITGLWSYPEATGIGAGIDSFYEYALKWYILSGEVEFLDVWDDAYASIMRYVRAHDGFWFRSVNMNSGDVAYYTVDSLSAFWPGLQVLGGDIRNAIKSHMMYWNLWRKHSGLPEVWDINFKQATSMQYPLRPEFIESTWYLYRATGDTFYLDVGERVLNDIIFRARVQCGLTGIRDLKSNARDDRMESFALSETIKYLYLLFDEENAINTDDSNYVFTTEGHILTLDKHSLKPISPIRRKLRGPDSHQCPIYEPFLAAVAENEKGLIYGLTQGVRAHPYVDYAREHVGITPEPADRELWSEYGWCEKPHYEQFSYDFIMSVTGQNVPEDLHPSTKKIEVVSDGYILHNVTGIRTHIVRRLDGRGYEITKLGPFAIRSGQLVYVNDSHLTNNPPLPSADDDSAKVPPHGAQQQPPGYNRNLDVPLKFYIQPTEEATYSTYAGMGRTDSPVIDDIEIRVIAQAALFGLDLLNQARVDEEDPLLNSHSSSSPSRPSRAGYSGGGFSSGLPLVRDHLNILGCQSYDHSYASDDDGNGVVLVVDRGECTFLEKMLYAHQAGAVGVVVLSDEEIGISPSATKQELEGAEEDIQDMAMVVLKHSYAVQLDDIMDLADAGMGQAMVALDSDWSTVVPDNVSSDIEKLKQALAKEASRDMTRMLYLNGHPLTNTRLVL